MNATLAAAAEQSEGWGKVVALFIAAGVFFLGVNVYERWKKPHTADHSPTAIKGGVSGVKLQVNGRVDPSGDPTSESGSGSSRDLDVFVGQHLGRRPHNQLVREAARRFRASESTVKRAIRKARAAAGKGGVS